MVDLPHVSFLSIMHLEDYKKFIFEKDLEFLSFSFELHLLKVVLLFFLYIKFILIKKLYELIFVESNLAFYLLNRFELDVFLF